MWIGIDVELNEDRGKEDPTSDEPSIFIIVENVFCIIFVVELWIRFAWYKKTKSFFTEPEVRNWNIFDLVLVIMMIIENWIIPILLASYSDFYPPNMTLLRMARLMRVTRLFHIVPELYMLVKSLL